ncbi:hypothetical protein C1A40_02875 [Tamlana carrageenivorans]|uniref:Uncharacterized protein n=2 Tax=Pseudotamlana carrageenivorans TaxID=2069432 RepID=A0A2I7SF10_9FLAO|nr:hypothetical protein C1A40_02875 [Tamlana carrageenivorans]
MVVEQGQSFLDMVLQETGSVENALAMAIENQLSITSDLQIGQNLNAVPVTNKRVAALFHNNNKPATHQTFPDSGNLSPILGGIDYMAIEVDFIVQ